MPKRPLRGAAKKGRERKAARLNDGPIETEIKRFDAKAAPTTASIADAVSKLQAYTRADENDNTDMVLHELLNALPTEGKANLVQDIMGRNDRDLQELGQDSRLREREPQLPRDHVFLPFGDEGSLVFMGGEVPSIAKGANATLSSNPWNHVQVYDIAQGKWYNQSTTGTVSSRTQFCAAVVHDESSSSYQIYVIGGADFESQDVLTDVSYLAIPSFKWYRAGSLTEGRMTHVCQPYGRQILGVGGRLAWAIDSKAGCYSEPVFLYDAVSEVDRTEFDPSLSSYSIPSSTSNDIKESPYPSTWADPALKSLFVSNNTSTASSTPTTPSSGASASHSANKGAIAGGVVGGVVGVSVIVALVVLFLLRRRKQHQTAVYQQQTAESRPWAGSGYDGIARELPATEVRGELEAQSKVRAELWGDDLRSHELPGTSGSYR